jgi:hypothetical protein
MRSGLVKRYDRGELEPAEKLANGWLRVQGRTARVGVLVYSDGDGQERRELVLPEELFQAESIKSACMVPVTNGHPAALLDATTARVHQVGNVGESFRPIGDYLGATFLITDGETVHAIEAGRRELSWGYECRIDPPEASLIPRWGTHDGIQRDRMYNHLAIVDEARAGPRAKLRLDSGAARMLGSAAERERDTERPMPIQIKIGDHRFDASEASASLIQQALDRELEALRGRADGSAKELDAAKAATDKIQRNLDAYRVRGNAFRDGLAVIIDAMKSRFVACDECGDSPHGKGMVSDGSGNPVKCGYCDGLGKFRFHDAIRSLPAAPDEEGHPDDDLAEVEGAMADGLAREGAGEEALEKGANAEHKDAAAIKAARKKRADARTAATQKRAESRTRIDARNAQGRASMLMIAAQHLGADHKLDAKSDLDIARSVVGKLAPHVQMVGLDAGSIWLLYRTELARVAAQGVRPDALSASDHLRAAVASGQVAAARAGSASMTLADARSQRDALHSDAWKRATPAK